MRTKFLVGLMFLSLLVPAVSLAASNVLAPEFNPLCWHKKECDEIRSKILKQDLKDVAKDTSGWLNEEPCDSEGWGKCLPAGVAVTQIAFGGKKQFSSIGDFLKTNYNIALTIAGILAVIMIIVAGVQWVTSGGNSEMITGAKKRIGGALTGLLIAYLSYTILNTVNPAMVNLRLPQTFLLRPFKIVPQYCRDTANANGTSFAKASDKGVKVDPKKMDDKNLKMATTTPDKMACGDNFFIEGGGGATCMGSACPEKGTTCLPFTTEGNKIKNNTPNCEKAQLAVHYTIDTSVKLKELFSGLSTADVEGKVWLSTTYNNPFWAVCQASSTQQLYLGNIIHDWDPGSAGNDRRTLEVESSPYNEYYLLINRLNPDGYDPVWTKDKWGCAVADGDKVAGFVFQSQFFVNLNLVNSNFFVSEKYVGPWISFDENKYISTSSLGNGILINAKIDSAKVDLLIKNKWTKPSIPLTVEQEKELKEWKKEADKQLGSKAMP